MNSNEIRDNNLKNIREIISQKQNLTSNQCDYLSKCLNILSQDNLTHKDSLEIDYILAKGKFGVMLPY